MSQRKLTKEAAPHSHPVFTSIITVKNSDVIYGRHLAAVAFPKLMQDARADFLHKHNVSEINLGNNIGIILRSFNIKYINEAFYQDQIKIDLHIENISKACFDITYNVSNVSNKKAIAIAHEEIVSFDYKSNKITSMPREFYDLITNFKSQSSC